MGLLLSMIETYGKLKAEGADDAADKKFAEIGDLLNDTGWKQLDAFWDELGIDGLKDSQFWKGIALMTWDTSREKLVMGADYVQQPPKFLGNGVIQTRP